MNNTSFMEKLLGLSDLSDRQAGRQAGGGFSFPPSSVGMHTVLLSDSVCIPTQERGNELELGAGFAFVGRQVLLQVGEEEFFIDLLFYHLKLRCYVVIELKADKFKPEHLGQLGFYMTAVDRQIKAEQDTATIGLLLCKSKDKVVAEYALGDKTQPMGIAEYKLQEALPETLETNLPSIEQIERELQGEGL